MTIIYPHKSGILVMDRWQFFNKSYDDDDSWNAFTYFGGFPGGDSGKESAWNGGDTKDTSLKPGSWRSHGVEKGNPLQYSCLENSTDRAVWQTAVHGATESQTWLSD